MKTQVKGQRPIIKLFLGMRPYRQTGTALDRDKWSNLLQDHNVQPTASTLEPEISFFSMTIAAVDMDLSYRH